MSEDRIFFQQAAEAIMQTSIHSSRIDPSIRELLNRIKHATANKEPVTPSPSSRKQKPQEIVDIPSNDSVNDKHGILNYFDQLLGSGRAEEAAAIGGKLTNIANGTSSRKRQKVHSSTAFEKASESSSHSADDSSIDERRFQCSKCDLVFRRSGDLRRHEKVHLSILPNICSLCGKGFARKDALKRHCGTLTCKRNRQKLLSIGGDINEILEKVRQNGAQV